MFVLTLAATTFGLVKVTQEVTKAKIAIAKENSVGSVRMEAIEKASKEMGGHIQDVSKIVDALKNKQEVDYEFLSRIFDNLEKDFQSYREIILNNLNRK